MKVGDSLYKYQGFGGWASYACTAVISRDKSTQYEDEKHTSYAYTVAVLATKPKRKFKYIYMHRLILGLTDPKIVVDHRNHDGLDNRRENIKPCTQAENLQNRKKSMTA